MRNLKLTSVDRVVVLFTTTLLVVAVIARIGPFSTVISEENLQVGYSRQILSDAAISPGSNVVPSPVEREFSLHDYQLTSMNGSIVLISHLPFASQFCLELVVEDINKSANGVVVYNRARVLTAIDFQKVQTHRTTVHVGAKSSEQIWFRLDDDSFIEPKNVVISIQRISKTTSVETASCSGL
jgi:hypothetical protein